MPLIEVGVTSRGYTIFREENGSGGHRYWSDAIRGGVCIWDTCLASPEELIVAMDCEEERISKDVFDDIASGVFNS